MLEARSFHCFFFSWELMKHFLIILAPILTRPIIAIISLVICFAILRGESIFSVFKRKWLTKKRNISSDVLNGIQFKIKAVGKYWILFNSSILAVMSLLFWNYLHNCKIKQIHTLTFLVTTFSDPNQSENLAVLNFN